MILPDATAFLNSLLDSDDQILITTPAYASFSSQRRSDWLHAKTGAFRVSEDQIPIASPDHACFSCLQWSDLDHIVELRMLFDLHGQLGKP